MKIELTKDEAECLVEVCEDWDNTYCGERSPQMVSMVWQIKLAAEQAIRETEK